MGQERRPVRCWLRKVGHHAGHWQLQRGDPKAPMRLGLLHETFAGQLFMTASRITGQLPSRQLHSVQKIDAARGFISRPSFSRYIRFPHGPRGLSDNVGRVRGGEHMTPSRSGWKKSSNSKYLLCCMHFECVVGVYTWRFPFLSLQPFCRGQTAACPNLPSLGNRSR
jgi:hypothetical protein